MKERKSERERERNYYLLLQNANFVLFSNKQRKNERERENKTTKKLNFNVYLDKKKHTQKDSSQPRKKKETHFYIFIANASSPSFFCSSKQVTKAFSQNKILLLLRVVSDLDIKLLLLFITSSSHFLFSLFKWLFRLQVEATQFLLRLQFCTLN